MVTFKSFNQMRYFLKTEILYRIVCYDKAHVCVYINDGDKIINRTMFKSGVLAKGINFEVASIMKSIDTWNIDFAYKSIDFVVEVDDKILI